MSEWVKLGGGRAWVFIKFEQNLVSEDATEMRWLSPYLVDSHSDADTMELAFILQDG